MRIYPFESGVEGEGEYYTREAADLGILYLKLKILSCFKYPKEH